MLLVLYTITTLYQSMCGPLLKGILHKRDDSAIYLLIAGSYTPLTLVTLRGPWGMVAVRW